MHYVARGILVVVAVFVLLVAGMLVHRTRAARVEPVGPAPSAADLRIKEVDLEEEDQGVRWHLKADQALTFEQEGRTTLKNLTVNVYGRDRNWTIVGKEGDLDRATRNVVVRGDVVVTSSDGLRLDTDVLRWDNATKRLWTNVPVRLSRDGSIVNGTGLEVEMSREETRVAGRVRATFVKPSAAR